ncbi:MAG TPA: prepilin-type N-terminal cleavage/methylation domain-containing protein [Candidatus Ozemobacteraceae bacterium]|nr:prepilin-type N-terminal cleavage/methylation domain-containing protein [Candidatus Ozemobacteraceae bacterium]
MKRRAFTLVEVAVSVLLASIIIYAVTRLFTKGMETSTKGAAHLTNVQSTALLLSQMEDDIQRAVDLSSMPPGAEEASAKVEILEESPSGLTETSIIYERDPSGRGMIRKRAPKTGTPEEHTYCRDLMILHHTFTRLDLPENRMGFRVYLKIGTFPKGTEVFEVNRFISCTNHASNTLMTGWKP